MWRFLEDCLNMTNEVMAFLVAVGIVILLLTPSILLFAPVLFAIHELWEERKYKRLSRNENKSTNNKKERKKGGGNL